MRRLVRQIRAFRGKQVAVLGAGLSGQSAARYLLRLGAEVVVFDERPHAKLDGELANIRLVCGSFDPERLCRFDAILVSPGIPWVHPALQQLRQRRARLLGELDLFARAWRGDVAAITGTNGKTTVTTLLSRLLAVLPGGAQAVGNIGSPMLDLLLQPSPPQRAVMELSSFQLERARPLRPQLAVLTSFAPDHLAAHGSMAAYRKAKERLFVGLRQGSTAILPGDADWDALAERLGARKVQVLRIGRDLGADARGIYWREGDRVRRIAGKRLRVRGMHQWGNVAIASQAAALFGVKHALIEEAATSFLGLPHRLQFAARAAGREWWNDSKATNAHAAKAALCSFDRVLWICGGVTKGASVAELAPIVARRVQRAFVIGKDPAPFLALCAQAGVPADACASIEEAVQRAAEAEPLPVLLAPAAASWDQFRSYAERGERFVAAVRAIERREREAQHAAA